MFDGALQGSLRDGVSDPGEALSRVHMRDCRNFNALLEGGTGSEAPLLLGRGKGVPVSI